MKALELIVVGLVAGLLSGIFGVGGGIVMVPLLIFVFKLPVEVAIGTSLMVIIPTAIMGSVRHAQLSHVDFQVAGLVAVGAVVAALVGASLTPYLGAIWLRRGFALLLLVTGARLLMK